MKIKKKGKRYLLNVTGKEYDAMYAALTHCDKDMVELMLALEHHYAQSIEEAPRCHPRFNLMNIVNTMFMER